VQLADQNNTLIERGVSVLVNYVLAPMVIVYALILHAYAVKIALQGELPKGQIGAMVTIFALGGTGAWLIAWPWRDAGTKLLRAFMRGWFWLTIVPAVLLVVAVWRRIADYGVTPDRYGLVLTAIWLAAVAAYLAIKRNRADMRAILGGIAVLLLIGAAGPWGAYGLTNVSQFARLTALMRANGLLKDGKVVLPAPVLESKVRKDGYSILYVLSGVGGLNELKPLFDDKNQERLFQRSSNQWMLVTDIAAALNFSEKSDAFASSNYVFFEAQRATNIDPLTRGRLIGPLSTNPWRLGQPQEELTAEIKMTNVIIRIDGRDWHVPVKKLLEAAQAATPKSDGSESPAGSEKQTGANLPRTGKLKPPLMVQIDPQVIVILIRIKGELGEPPQLHSADFWVMMKPT
jgi:hypothetical protein